MGWKFAQMSDCHLGRRLTDVDKSLADALVDIRNAGSPLLWYDEPWE